MQRFLAPITDLFRSSSKGRYSFDFNLLNAQAQFNTYYKDKEKLAAVLSNPALLKVVSIQCDLFSLGKFYLKDSSDEYIESDPLLDFLNKPNPLQSGAQFRWDYMFWNMLGNSYMYIDSKILNSNNKAYFLETQKIDFPTSLELEKDKLIFSQSKLNSILNTILTYVYDDGTSFKFPLRKLLISHDLTNGVGNMYKGISRIDALYKIISNSEYALDSKNINLRYSGKFMVGSENNEHSVGLTPEEKKDINNNMGKDEKEVYPMQSLIKIQRFVTDFAKLKLSESYLDDYFLIGNMYNIPRDVLEAYQSSTYENQEKARGSHVSYTLQPKGDEFCDQLSKYFGYKEEGKQLIMDWSHLPFMQVFEHERADTIKAKVETIKLLIELGYSKEEAEKVVDL